MKGKFKTALMICLGAVSMLVGFTDVQASTLVRETVPNVFYARSGGGKPYGTSFVENYTMDGKVVYCIEAGVAITTNSYVGQTGWINSPFSDEINQKMQLIGYYGYDYPGHQTQRFRLATQSLIWEVSSGQKIELWTEIGGYGDYINVDYERNEIMKLVNAHYQVPSFNNETKTAIVGQPITFTDTTGVLSGYEIYKSNGATSSINGNTLTVTPNNVGEVSVSLIRKLYTTDSTTVFVGIDGKSQKMAYFGVDDPVVVTVKLNVLGGRVEIIKSDADTGSTISISGQADLTGAKYGVFDLNDNLITELTTDSNSYAISDYLPGLNVYYLKELSAPKGYVLDETKHYFKLDKDNLLVRVNVSDRIIKNKYEITKVVASNLTSIMTPEVGVDFGIYDFDNNLVLKLTTDNEGKIYFTLPYGDYTLRQLSTLSGYEKLEDYNFSIKEDGLTINKVFSNAEITSRVKVIKIDDSGNVITKAGIKFKIKDTSTGEYVCQKISYPNKTICEYETSSDGTLITPYPLNSGKYQLKELDQAIDGYLWNSEPIEFSIDENSNIISSDGFDAIIEIKFENKEVKGAVEINKTGEKVVIENGSYTYEEIKLPNVIFGLYDENGNLIQKITTDNNGYARIENLKLGKYVLKELSSSNNNMVDTTEYEFELVYKDQYTPVITKTFTLKNYLAKGTIEFSKTDLTTGKVIPNTKVDIYYVDESTESVEEHLIFSGITDKNGNIKIDNLFTGKFYIVETEPSTGYKLSEEKVFFEIKENGQIVKANMTNEKIKGSLEFTKTDFSTSETLPNTVIEIYSVENDKLIFSGKTDKDGKIVINEIEYGKYYIIEKEAPVGYVINEEKMYFEILKDGEIIKANMTNEKIKGTLDFTKTDFSTSETLPNTVIEIYSVENDKLIFSGKTDKDGKIVINEIEYGKYYIIEKEAPVGYVINEEKMYFEILKDGEIIKANMTNEKITGDLVFKKVDENGNPLAGVSINLYNSDGTLIGTYVTDENGLVKVENLEYNDYLIKEITTLEGYLLSDETLSFEIKEDGEVVEVSMVNEKITGNLVFKKVDENGNPLAGVSINLYNSDGTLIGTYVTDDNGIVIIEDLEYSDYYIKEIATIDGYELSDETLYFSIIKNDTDVEVSMINVKLPQTDMNDYSKVIAISIIGLGTIMFVVSCSRKKRK